VEAALGALYPKKKWTLASDTFILHGRRICKPTPQCRICNARRLCDYAQR
jgi:endonuclease III